MNADFHKREFCSNSFCFGSYNVLVGKASLPFWSERKETKAQINI